MFLMRCGFRIPQSGFHQVEPCRPPVIALHVMRASPCWTHTIRPHHQDTSSRQLGLCVQFGFSRQPCTQTAISPSYSVQIRCSWMRWKPDDETLLLVLVLAPEASWIILCDYDKVLCHLFWAEQAFVSCQALSTSFGRPQP